MGAGVLGKGPPPRGGTCTEIRVGRDTRRLSPLTAPLAAAATRRCGFAPFLAAYNAQSGGAAPTNDAPGESAACFRTLLQTMRGDH